MTWTKVDDHLHSHPKILAAWHANRASLGLHLLALSHAGAHLTDGHVSEAFVRAQLPSAAQRQRAVGALLDAGLWDANGSGWVIHDYLDYNEPREQVLDRRTSRSADAAEAGRKGARKRWRSGATSPPHDPAAHCLPYGEQIAPTRPVPTPDPFS